MFVGVDDLLNEGMPDDIGAGQLHRRDPFQPTQSLKPVHQSALAVGGQVDLLVDLSGRGATRYDFLKNAAGRITVIGGSGKIKNRKIDLWAADLIPTMLSPRWQRQDAFDVNCTVAHIELKEGFAKVLDFILDSQRITVASSGLLNLETEALDLVMVPKPKKASAASMVMAEVTRKVM